MLNPDQSSSPIEGLYEQLITEKLSDRINKLRADGWFAEELAVEDKETSAEILTEHIAGRIRDVLNGISTKGQVDTANRILASLRNTAAPADPVELVASEDSSKKPEFPGQLLALRQADDIGDYEHRPTTPLTKTALLTNMPNEPRLGSEIRQELATADQIDLLCAFIKWTGLRLLEEPLARARARGVPIRVITTTYMGATERRAIDWLVREFGAEVKINYEQRSTRLHAKAWLFRRNTGYDTAYVGSSNLSQAALLDGLEWNVRLSAQATPDVMRKFELTFDSYWESPAFEDYDPDRNGDRLDEALAAAGNQTSGTSPQVKLSGLDVHPYPYQRDMLERLETAREVHGHHRNLLVAATGTGKTVMAALDYKRLCEIHGSDLKLLFVAHRDEILNQSMRTYQEVLNDHDFGEKLGGGNRPRQRRHVFASIQSLAKLPTLGGFSPDHFDVVVIDEFHHGTAKTYRRIVDYFTPKELLGLTATPERTDGETIQDAYFDGRITAELRLWEALENELLSPFHYFGISDNTDMSAVTWKRGGYDTTELDTLLTGNDARARLILTAVREKVTDPSKMRALGFCVSIAHAHYMADRFEKAGIKAVALSGQTKMDERKTALKDLNDGRIQIIFSADLL
ncbi:MAG: DEAD/DEAH box helicase family protein, partial [Nocardiopsaceae bacterium]|nr:DEAD/DEAH box helicase family protein [Nocardiopsaceae bacterium]